MKIQCKSSDEVDFNLELDQIPSCGELIQAQDSSWTVTSVLHLEKPNEFSAVIKCERESKGGSFFDYDWS